MRTHISLSTLIVPLACALFVGLSAPRAAAQTAADATTPAATTAGAQPVAPVPATQAARPKIGLALGGGSARGMAHVGVLEWFEQHHIPIDYIAGTSMGGLVAGAYATGMTPAEIRELMRTTDWDLMFISDTPFKYKTFRRKEDRRAYPAQLEFGLKGGFSLPGGLNPGQQVSLMLDRVALPYYDLRGFDDLPTPFRCVATDLKKSEPVVLSDGLLSQALRATMAIPGLFTPVVSGDRLLVDGGVLNNIPANVVKAMGADIVIAVNVGADAVQDEQARQSLFSLLGRTLDTMMTVGTREALKSADLIVDPDLTGLNSMDWRRSDDLADRGYQAAAGNAARLDRFAVSPAEHAALLAARASKRRTTLQAPAFIDVTGVGDPARGQIEARFAPLVGQPLDEAAIRRAILDVGGTDRFEFLTYRPVERDGKLGLQVQAQLKTYGPPFLNLGLDVNNIDSTAFAVNIGGRVTAYDWIGYGSEVRIDGIIGTRQTLFGEIYRPLGAGGLFFAPRGYYNRYPRNFYANDQQVAEYRVREAGGGVDLGWTSGRRAELRFGVDVADVVGSLRIGQPTLPEVEGTQKFGRLRFAWDGQTSPIVPTNGLHQIAEVRYYFGAPEAIGLPPGETVESVQEFWQADVTGLWAKRMRNRKDRLLVKYGVGTSFGEDPLINDFALGGPLALGAFNNDELTGSNYVLGSVGYLVGVGRLPDVLGQNIFLGAFFEQGSAFDEWDDATYRSSVTVGAILETLLGPIFGGLSADFDGRFRAYIAVGPIFR